MAAVPSELLIPQSPASHDRVVLALGFHERASVLEVCSCVELAGKATTELEKCSEILCGIHIASLMAVDQ
jgi:hypothetical protein